MWRPRGPWDPSTLHLCILDPSTTDLTPSRDEDLETVGLEDDSSDGLDGAKPPVQSIIGPDGLREFIMLPIWMVNDFVSTIKESHFKTLRAKYQVPINIPMRLPCMSEKCYYEDVEGIGVYEQMLKAGLRFPLSSLHYCLLQYLGLVVTQISPNAWKVFLGAMVLYVAMSNEARRLTVEEFFNCYRLVEIAQSKGMYSFVPRSLLLRLMYETLNSNRNWKSRYFFLEGDKWMCRLADHEYMPVDTTWGIMPLSSMHPSIFKLLIVC